MTKNRRKALLIEKMEITFAKGCGTCENWSPTTNDTSMCLKSIELFGHINRIKTTSTMICRFFDERTQYDFETKSDEAKAVKENIEKPEGDE